MEDKNDLSSLANAFLQIWRCSVVGPKPGAPWNLTVTEIQSGFLISWMPPLERADLVRYYTIKYKTDGDWMNLSKGRIRPEETSYLGK